MIIKKLAARAIRDSRGEFTIEVQVNRSRASAPAGKSTGKHETPAYHRSLKWNLAQLNSFQELRGLTLARFEDLEKVEETIRRKYKFRDARKFGANPLFALECACLKEIAREKGVPLWAVLNDKARKIPVPVGNAVGGGLHSHNRNAPTFQEFLVVPQARSFRENYEIMRNAHRWLKRQVRARTKNDEGAWQTSLSEEEVFSAMTSLARARVGTDIAASSFYSRGKYVYKNKVLRKREQIEYVLKLIREFKLFYVEDPLHEEDFEGFSSLLSRAPRGCMIVGDDLTATQLERLNRAIKLRSINAMIVKPNQNGSLLELKRIIETCKKNRIKTILSHRSGETLDNALADLAVGFQTDYIKTGISTKWREAKLKRLAEIEREIVN
ncbi:hypothetical protein D6817_02540 [Candidatus Pacearchaeota archaeon]|nr:MAG: hypothetical protein D6817_02540 [Candidatus Pacearchaeota archaeon]